jgi:hypothetical protein
VKKSTETKLVAWLFRKVRQVCDGGRWVRFMYFETLVSPMSMPSLSSSPWMRGAPQSVLSAHFADQVPDLSGDLWSARLSTPGLPV